MVYRFDATTRARKDNCCIWIVRQVWARQRGGYAAGRLGHGGWDVRRSRRELRPASAVSGVARAGCAVASQRRCKRATVGARRALLMASGRGRARRGAQSEVVSSARRPCAWCAGGGALARNAEGAGLSRPRWRNTRSMTGGCSMHAITSSRPPQAGQISISMRKTRLRRRAQVMVDALDRRERSAAGVALSGVTRERPCNAGRTRRGIG